MGRRKREPPPAFATIRPTWDKNHYVMLFDDMLDSPAYIALSAHAKEAYVILRQEYKGPYTGSEIICPYSTFAKKGMRANTLSRALTELEYFGFIHIDHGGLEHLPNRYRFSEDWKKIKTKEDVDKVKAAFKEEMDRRKKVRKKPKEDIPPDGIYIRSNGSVSNRDEKSGQITNESDSNRAEEDIPQLTKAIASQVTDPIVGNENQGKDPPEGPPAERIDLQLLKALVEGMSQDQHETLTEPIATEIRH